jgi:hypothetical protein
MSYSNFTAKILKRNFNIEQKYHDGLFQNVPPRKVSDLLKAILKRDVKFALDQGTEKARSEFIIAPVFAELKQQAHETLSIFSGWELNVDTEKGLTGRCDFLVSRTPYQAVMEAPIVVAVEAKQDDFEKGISQCIAEMLGARIYNQQEGNAISTIYGCVTTGDIWRFLVLRENLAEIATKTFDITDELEHIFGILWAMSFGQIK